MWKFACAVIVASLPAGPWVPAGAAPVPEVLHQTVYVDGSSAEAIITPDYQHGGHRVDVIFRASKGSAVRIACVSAYRDVHFELRDGAGNVIPINQQALENPRYGESSDVWSVSKSGSEIPCADQALQQQKLVAFLTPLYPHLSPGSYTLRIAFAPRGRTQRAKFAPVRISVDSQHPL